MKYYILENSKPKEVDCLTWAKWFEKVDRVIERTEVGNVMVSTVFLGLNYNFYQEGPPLLYETLVFGGNLDGEIDRYETLEQAQNGHVEMVDRVGGMV